MVRPPTILTLTTTAVTQLPHGWHLLPSTKRHRRPFSHHNCVPNRHKRLLLPPPQSQHLCNRRHRLLLPLKISRHLLPRRQRSRSSSSRSGVLALSLSLCPFWVLVPNVFFLRLFSPTFLVCACVLVCLVSLFPKKKRLLHPIDITNAHFTRVSKIASPASFALLWSRGLWYYCCVTRMFRGVGRRC